MQPDKAIRLRDVKVLVPKSTGQIYAEIAEGLFPKQFPIGKRSVAWWESEVLAYRERMANSKRPSIRVPKRLSGGAR